MKVNTGSGMMPNSFGPVPEQRSASPDDFHRHVVALDNTMASSLPSKERISLPARRLSVRKIKEVLRLHSLGLAQRQIARSCSIGQSTVSEYLKAAEAVGLRWPDAADWDEARLAVLLPPKDPVPPRSRLPEPDFPSVHAELQKHKHLTLQMDWEEYRTTHPQGYRYSRFCELYQRWRRQLEVVLRLEHRAGGKQRQPQDRAASLPVPEEPASDSFQNADDKEGYE